MTLSTRFNGHLITADTVDAITRAEYAIAIATGLVANEWRPWRIDAPRTRPQHVATVDHHCDDYAWCHASASPEATVWHVDYDSAR